MGLRINTNVASLAAQRTLGINTNEHTNTLAKLSSGSRITKAADDAAGLAISEKLKSMIRGANQAERNANDGISLVQVAEGGLNEIQNILVRLRELSIQAASDTVGDTERGFLDLEYQSLKKEVDRIAASTEFNSKKLLDGSTGDLEIQVGIKNDPFLDRIVYSGGQADATTSALGIDSLSVATKADAQAGLAALDDSIVTVSGQRAIFGALQNRLLSTIQNLQVTSENLSAANSRIRDADFALETSKNAKLNILTAANTAMLAQANTQGQLALKLVS